MKLRLLSFLLILCLLLTATPVLGAGGNFYGVLSQCRINYEDNAEVCMVRMILPDSSTADYTLANQVNIDGVYMSDVNEIYDYLYSHAKSYTNFAVTNDKITALYFSGTTGSSYTNVAYSAAYGTFTGIPGGTGTLPIYYKYNGTYYPPYLDGNNYVYDVTVYGSAIEITSMKSKNTDYTIYTLGATPQLDGALNMTIYVEGVATPGGVTLDGILYNSAGTKVCEVSCPVDGSKNVALDFTGIPNQAATYRMEVWLAGENGVSLSPKRSLTVETEAIPITTATILNKEIQTGWSRYVMLQLELEDGATAVAVSNSVIINGVKYSTANEIYSNLLIGSEIRFAENEDGEIYVVAFEKPVADTYGVVTQVINEGDGNASVSLVLPGKNYGEYGYYLNPNFVKNLENLDTWCRNLEVGSCVKFGVDQEYGTTITAMDIDEDGEKTYTDIHYQSNTGTFAELSSDTKDLPIYYYTGERYSAPVIEEKSVLNDDALYDIKVYAYGIVITHRDYAEINVLNFYPAMNMDFRQDLEVAYGIWDESAVGKTLQVQLLDANGEILERATKVINDGNTEEDSSVWFRDYPNEDVSYHLKLWIANESGNQISPTYTEKSFSYMGATDTAQQEIQNGIIVSENLSTNTSLVKIQVKSYPGGIQTTQYHTFSPFTKVNGQTFQSAAELAAALPEGTLMEYAFNSSDSNIAVIRFSEGKQQVISSANYDQTEKKVTAKITLRSNDAKEGDTSSVVGTVYAGVYNEAGFLRGITTIPETELKADGTAKEVPFVVEGITLEPGDYIKAFFWGSNKNEAIANVATAKIES